MKNEKNKFEYQKYFHKTLFGVIFGMGVFWP